MREEYELPNNETCRKIIEEYCRVGCRNYLLVHMKGSKSKEK